MRLRGGAVALVLALAVAVSGTAAGEVTPAGAQQCVYVKHTKRLVRWVKRHGKPRRVVRQRVWWTCRVVAPVLPPPPPDPPVDPVPLPTGPARLGVKADEFNYVLTRPSVIAGDVIIELDNRGEDPHNLNIARADGSGPALEIPEIGPLSQLSGRFSLSPGSYRLWCSLPSHESWGMTADLLVTG